MEIRGSGHLELDRSIDPRAKRRVSIDLSRVDHISVYGVVGIACAVLHAAQEGLPLQILPPSSASASSFMSSLGFERFVQDTGRAACTLPITTSPRPADVIVELRTFSSSEQLQPLQDLLWDRLGRTRNSHLRDALVEALWELGANVTEHSGSMGIVAACVQRPNRRDAHVAFAVGDAGKGLRRSFLEGSRPNHPATDHEAITLALTYLVSSVTDAGRGQGLTTTVKQAVELKGKVVVRSGTARRSITSSRWNPAKLSTLHLSGAASSVPELPGMLVAADLPCR
jgi:hypothetical protein